MSPRRSLSISSLMLAALLAASALLLGGLTGAAGTAMAAGTGTAAYAPPDRPGPALSVPAATLAAALACHGDFTGSGLEPVLLNPATGVTPEQNFSWNYEQAFNTQGRPWCAITMPYRTLGDIQTAGEYLVYAIRTERAMAHGPIAVLGHSQGGMSMRWALRFWPDTRPMVDDIIGMAGSNHGTTVMTGCRPGQTNCPPADWQQIVGSNFIGALNSFAETWPGISYTEIFTHTDEVVQPNNTDVDSSSALHTGAGSISNISTQDICPGDMYEHLAIGTIDPAAYALVIDALNHTGPARASRITDRSICPPANPYQPGVNATSANNIQALEAAPGLLSVSTPDANIVGAPEVPGEPALRCYVFAAGCQQVKPASAMRSQPAPPKETGAVAVPLAQRPSGAGAVASPARAVVGTPTFTG